MENGTIGEEIEGFSKIRLLKELILKLPPSQQRGEQGSTLRQ